MTLELGSFLGALALIAIPLVTWLSGRFTKEARLLHRIERWGKAYGSLPECAGREDVGEALASAGAELGAWIDINSRSLRSWKIWSNIGAIAVAGAVGAVLQPVLYGHGQVAAFCVLVGLGMSAGIGSVLLTDLIERRAAHRAATESSAAKEAAFRAGRPLRPAG